MKDNLFIAAKTFNNILNKTYNIVLGFKGKATYLNISFDTSNFKHLAGLHKLKDISVSKELPTPLFYKILNKEITYKDLNNSEYITDIKDRINDLINYEKYIDITNNIYSWNIRYAKEAGINTIINANYLFKEKSLCIVNSNAFLFFIIDKIDKNNKIFLTPANIEQLSIVSFFNNNKNYAEKQKQYTLLYKEKIDLNTNNKEILFQYPRFSLDK